MNTTLTNKQKNRLRRLKLVSDEGLKGLLKELNALEDRIEETFRVAKGDKGDAPTDAELLTLIRPLIPEPLRGDDGHTPTPKELLALIRPLIPEVKDGETPSDERLLDLILPLIPPPKDGSPDTPEQIVEKLSSLEGDDRLDASAIKGLEELLAEAKRLLTPSRVGGFFGGRVAHIPMVDDFSEQTNGSDKTFYLSKAPRSVTTMKIWGSDFPYILRANTDFTLAGKLLTLTSEVDAPSSGATLIAEYYI